MTIIRSKEEQTYLLAGLYTRLFRIRKLATDALSIASRLDTPGDDLKDALGTVEDAIKRHLKLFHLQGVPTAIFTSTPTDRVNPFPTKIEWGFSLSPGYCKHLDCGFDVLIDAEVKERHLGECPARLGSKPTKQKCESCEGDFPIETVHDGLCPTCHFATDDAKQIPNPEKFGRVDNMQAVDVWGLYCAVGDILSWCRGRGPAELPDDFIARAEATQDAVAKRFGFTDKKGER